MDTCVRPTTPVVNYRIEENGLEAHQLGKFTLVSSLFSPPVISFMRTEQGLDIAQVQLLVAEALSGKTVVGHSLWKDFYASIIFLLHGSETHGTIIMTFIPF